ncbi:hypothetical protein Ocin01_07105 [Orchesella cincta]|uniref:Uncharacterized protein n=1 Tax=Orchesella cincta TaxID=48709 RepID=A0A1D2N3E2_ORCCI|nr:hypothetical protein Ocin01_07105 [Orchesella cincta]
MASNKGPALYTHWKRPHTRMYDYNYQVAEAYYKPQVRYIGPASDNVSRRARRRTASPPGARTFLERWAADPFYGRTRDVSVEAESLLRAQNRASSMVRASSNPDLSQWAEYDEIERQRNIRSTTSRARSVVSYEGDYAGDYNDYVNLRRSRARSVSTTRPVDDLEVQWEWDRDGDFDELVRRAKRDEREKSVFSMRMALDIGKRVPMTTTLSHGCYTNSLYGTETWDPTPFLNGRQ